MSLINPGPGDLFDRLVILSLKIFYGRYKGIEPTVIKRFEREHSEIAERLGGHPSISSKDWHAMGVLIGSNALIWTLQDILDAKFFGTRDRNLLATQCIYLNKERAQAAAQLNGEREKI